jgi:hypothetical protein
MHQTIRFLSRHKVVGSCCTAVQYDQIVRTVPYPASFVVTGNCVRNHLILHFTDPITIERLGFPLKGWVSHKIVKEVIDDENHSK